MVRSMTGFGRGEARAGRFTVRAEIRSVNNRNLRVIYRMPDLLQSMENDFNNVLRDTIIRGSVTVAFNVDETGGEPGYELDLDVIRHYREALRELDASAPLSLEGLAALPGAVRKKVSDETEAERGEAAIAALRQAQDALVASRETEGRFIWEDMLARCKVIRALVDRIEARVPVMVEEYRHRLAERLGKLLEGVSAALTQDDLRKEIALFADRSDISEEITRMRSHLELMESMGKVKEPIGRKLEFITQEMFREANTMGAKANDAAMVHDALDIKAEVEKLREQSLNIE